MKIQVVNKREQRIKEIDARRFEVLDQLAAIKGQVECAEARFQRDKEKADPLWLSRARAKIRHLGVEHQRLQMERSELVKEAKAKRAINFERTFVDVAREVLDPPVCTELFTLTHDRVSGGRHE